MSVQLDGKTPGRNRRNRQAAGNYLKTQLISLYPITGCSSSVSVCKQKQQTTNSVDGGRKTAELDQHSVFKWNGKVLTQLQYPKPLILHSGKFTIKTLKNNKKLIQVPHHLHRTLLCGQAARTSISLYT